MKTIVLTLGFLMLIGLGCKIPGLGTNTGGNSDAVPRTGSNALPAGGNPITVSGNPRDDIIQASQRFTSSNVFQAKMDGTGARDMHMQVDYVAPDRYHINNSGLMETIIIGKETYLKTGGAWKKFPVNLSETIPNMRDAFTEEGMKHLTEVEYVGEDAVNGTDAFLYQYKGKLAAEGSSTYASKLWIGKNGGLPLKIEVEYASGPLKRMTTNYSYDPGVTIEAPPTK